MESTMAHPLTILLALVLPLNPPEDENNAVSTSILLAHVSTQDKHILMLSSAQQATH